MRVIPILLITLFLLSFVSLSLSLSSSTSPHPTSRITHPHIIHFENESLDTLTLPRHTPSNPSLSTPPVKSHYLVHHKPPLTPSVRQSLESTLETPLTQYLPHHTFLVYTYPHNIDAISNHPSVSWTGDYPPSAKLHSSLGHLYNEKHAEKFIFSVSAPNGIPEGGIHKTFDSDDIQAFSTGIEVVLNVALGSTLDLPTTMTLANTFHTDLLRYLHDALLHEEDDLKVQVVHEALLRITLPSEGMISTVSHYLATQPSVRLITRQAKVSVDNRHSRGLSLAGFDAISYTGNGNAQDLISFTKGLRGQGQIIGTSDTGLDVNSCFFYDPNFPDGPPTKQFQWYSSGVDIEYSRPEDHQHRKVVQYVAYQGMNHITDDHFEGHGTHTAGTLAGRLVSGPSTYNGMAPDAKLAIFDMGNLTAIPNSLGSNMLLWTYSAGARIHSNSWTSNDQFGYNDQSNEIDEFVYYHPDMLVLFSASNKGASNPAGQQLPAPATNKNGITIGASMSSRQHWLELTGEGGLGYDSDVFQAVSNMPTYFSSDNLACFSSRGPTQDGRIKPDLVANGFYIVSARNGQDSATSCDSPPSSLLRVLPGTSQATPTVGGLAALVREYFQKGFYPPRTINPQPENAFNPSAALVKAMLIGSGRQLTGYVDRGKMYEVMDRAHPGGTKMARECAVTFHDDLEPDLVPLSKVLPNGQQGFGRVTLSDSLTFFGDELSTYVYRPLDKDHADDFGDPFLEPGDQPTTFQFCYEGASSNDQPVRITLVWTDPPAQANAGNALVHDLDLVVQNIASGQFYWGNGHQDQINNVEQVRVMPDDAAPSTTFTVQISPSHLTRRQSYSVVVTGRVNQGPCDHDLVETTLVPLITDISPSSVQIADKLTSLISVSFIAPSTASTFQLIVEPGTHMVTGSTSPLALTGLDPRKDYTATIKATTNSPYGDATTTTSKSVKFDVSQFSALSTSSPSVGTSTIPVVTAVADSLVEVNGQTYHHVSIAFTAPSLSPSAPPPSAYIVVSSPGGFHVVGPNSPLTIANIPNGDYTFRISALDSSGNIMSTSTDSSSVSLLHNDGSLYSWNQGEWTDCSVVCDSGIQTRDVWCESPTAGKVDDSYCLRMAQTGVRPATSQSCNQQFCGSLSYEWHITPWTTCSAQCGGGHQSRQVVCATESGIPMQDIYCADAPKPLTLQTCHETACDGNGKGSFLSFHYKVSSCITDCSNPCGSGTCTRTIQCQIGMMDVNDDSCTKQGIIKPPTTTACVGTAKSCSATGSTTIVPTTSTGPAIHFNWISGTWSACTSGCGGGTQSRPVRCWASTGHYEDESKCLIDSPKPSTSRPCNSDPCPAVNNPAFQWIVGPFTTCLPDTMDHRRWVVCADTAGRHHPATRCEAQIGKIPSISKPCTAQEKTDALTWANTPHPTSNPDSNIDFFWVAGVFGMQSTWCTTDSQRRPTTTKTRYPFCVGTDGIVSNSFDADCGTPKPDSSLVVTLDPCDSIPAWHHGTWAICDNMQDPCQGTEYRKSFCVDAFGAILQDKNQCANSNTPQPANQRAPCHQCTSKTPIDGIAVPVYGGDLDAKVLASEAPTTVNEATGIRISNGGAQTYSALSADTELEEALPFNTSVHTNYITPTYTVGKGNSGSMITSSFGLVVAGILSAWIAIMKTL